MKKIALILAAVMLLACAAGCDNNSSKATATGAPLSTTAAVPPAVETKENIWLLEPEYTSVFVGQAMSASAGMFEGKLGVYVTDDTGVTKCGYVSADGGFAIDPVFGQVNRFSYGYASAVSHIGDPDFGVIDEHGNFVSPADFSYIGQFGANGLAPAIYADTNKYGYINTKGELAIMPVYDLASHFVDGYALTTTFDDDFKATYGFIGTDGKLLGDKTYLLAQNFSEGYAAVWEGKDFASAKAGYIGTDGTYVIEPQFKTAGAFAEGLAPAVPADGELYGFIDATGKFVIEPQFVYTNGFSDGLAMVGVKNDDGTVTEGYIDATGKFVIDPIYYGCQNFRDGYASVATKELFESGTGVKIILDRNGNVVVGEDLVLEDGVTIASVCYGNVVVAAKDGKFGIIRLADVE